MDVNQITDALDKVNKLSGNTFVWNEESTRYGEHDTGVIAQEVQSVLPEAVTEREDGYLAVDYQGLIPLLIEAIRTLSEKVDSLEQKLNDNN